MRQLPEQCASCGRQIATLERCTLPDGREKRGAEVTFRESAESGILCLECASRPPQGEYEKSHGPNRVITASMMAQTTW